MYKVRLRTPAGISELPEFDPQKTTFIQLLETVCDKISDAPPPHCLRIKAGFPPKEIYGKRDQPVCEIMENRETLVADRKDPDPLLLPPADDKEIPDSTPSMTNGEGSVVRRVVPSDNSCLFTSIGYVLESGERPSAEKLRKVISQQLLNQPDEYNEVVLGEDPVSYAAWILKPEHWGGSIELALFSHYYKTEIGVGDIKSCRLDIYEADITKFHPEDKSVEESVRKLCESERGMFKYTDTSEFTIRCLVCREGLKGVDEAQKHAAATNHQQFAEYL